MYKKKGKKDILKPFIKIPHLHNRKVEEFCFAMNIKKGHIEYFQKNILFHAFRS